MHLYALAHPIDTERFPDQPAGWVWAVTVGDDHSNAHLRLCAGWCPEQGAAVTISEQACTACVKVARECGVPCDWETVVLDSDPVPAGRDFVSVG